LIRSIRVARALVRAASAFFAVLVRGAGSPAPEPIDDREAVVLPPSAGVENRCPVCQARFRVARICSRCGANLEPLMVLAVKSWQLREAARQALHAGDAERALDLAAEAQGIQGTQRGEALRLLSAWLTT
jgi:hypothetical protein